MKKAIVIGVLVVLIITLYVGCFTAFAEKKIWGKENRAANKLLGELQLVYQQVIELVHKALSEELGDPDVLVKFKDDISKKYNPELAPEKLEEIEIFCAKMLNKLNTFYSYIKEEELVDETIIGYLEEIYNNYFQDINWVLYSVETLNFVIPKDWKEAKTNFAGGGAGESFIPLSYWYCGSESSPDIFLDIYYCTNNYWYIFSHNFGVGVSEEVPITINSENGFQRQIKLHIVAGNPWAKQVGSNNFYCFAYYFPKRNICYLFAIKNETTTLEGEAKLINKIIPIFMTILKNVEYIDYF